MKLYATPLSHFARKVRVLLELYAIPYDMINAGNMAEIDMQEQGQNPLMQVPVLIDGDTWLIHSDHIAEYIVRQIDAEDQYKVLITESFHLNTRAIMNGIMDNEVKLVLGERTGIPIEQYVFFDKAKQSIHNALAWLEHNADRFSTENLTYQEIHLICLWQHLAHYNLVSLDYPHLAQIVSSHAGLPQLKKTAPV